MFQLESEPLPLLSKRNPIELAVARAMLTTLRTQLRGITADLEPGRYESLRRFLTYTSATLSNHIAALDNESAQN